MDKELHEEILQRLHDIWNESYLTIDEFQIAYDEIKQQIEEGD